MGNVLDEIYKQSYLPEMLQKTRYIGAQQVPLDSTHAQTPIFSCFDRRVKRFLNLGSTEPSILSKRFYHFLKQISLFRATTNLKF